MKKLKKKIFLITVIIPPSSCGIERKLDLGIDAMISMAINFAIGHGIVVENEPDIFSGYMKDVWGKSEITNFKLNDTELNFSKRYPDSLEILFSFKKKDGNMWIGNSSGKCFDYTQIKCIITPTDDSFVEWEKKEAQQSIH